MSVQRPPVSAAALRRLLVAQARRRRTLTYRDAAARLALAPPLSIHRLADALEAQMAEDARAGRPMLAALVVSRRDGGALPAPGFFAAARALGVYDGDEQGPDAETFHATQLAAVYADPERWAAADAADGRAGG